MGRSAGRIFWDDNLKKYIRPSQICNQKYGEGIVFSSLDLSEKEITIKQLGYQFIPKNNLPYYSRYHHIDFKDDLIAIDYAIKKREINY